MAGGETVRDLSARSGARIDVTPEHMADPTSMERQVTIQGTPDAIERARQLIDDIVNAGPPFRVRFGSAQARERVGICANLSSRVEMEDNLDRQVVVVVLVVVALEVEPAGIGRRKSSRFLLP